MRILKLFSTFSVRESIGLQGNMREHNGDEDVVNYGPGREQAIDIQRLSITKRPFISGVTLTIITYIEMTQRTVNAPKGTWRSYYGQASIHGLKSMTVTRETSQFSARQRLRISSECEIGVNRASGRSGNSEFDSNSICAG